MFNRTVTATISTTRRRNAPGALPLHQPYRRTNLSPQSPLAENIFLQRSMATPASPSAFFVPVTPQPLTPKHNRRRLENLTRCLKSSAPAEITYPSLAQVSTEAESVTSFLDLYRKCIAEDEYLRMVKSPTSREEGESWRSLQEAVKPEISVQRKPSIRRGRSLGDLRQLESIVKGEPTNTGTPGMPVIHLTREEEQTTELAHKQSHSLDDAKQAIVSADTKHMAEFRRGFGLRPRELALSPVPPPVRPLPSPSPPSALLSVQSPRPNATPWPRRVLPLPLQSIPAEASGLEALSLRSPQAPYWVKLKSPKTPRTLRSQRRQGWGGAWNIGDMERIVGQLRTIS